MNETIAPGRLKAAIFDWAGTMVDFGSRAPMGVFVRAFAEYGVKITMEEARGPMGLPKRAHIAALMGTPRIADAWCAAQGSAPDAAAIDRVYDTFIPMNVEVVSDYAELVLGAAETVAALRERGLKIGSTTGYTREIMAPLLPLAEAQGYSPDNLVCAGDLPEGRPSPLMMYRTFLDLSVYPASACVKIDDTEPGIAEGVAAGTWTVGVSLSGNLAGLSREEFEALTPAEVDLLRADADEKLKAAGAHYAIDSVADLIPVIEAIEERLAKGDMP